jgi:DNA-binding transcriptional MerR regulator
MSSRLLRIGEIAKEVGVSPDTLRYYERMGLLPQIKRSNGGYRQYPGSTVQHVRLIRNALQFGFSLKQVAGFVRARESGCPPCHKVRAAGQQILASVDQQIKELKVAQRIIRATLGEWDRLLSSASPGQAAKLLQTLGTAQMPKRRISVSGENFRKSSAKSRD